MAGDIVVIVQSCLRKAIWRVQVSLKYMGSLINKRQSISLHRLWSRVGVRSTLRGLTWSQLGHIRRLARIGFCGFFFWRPWPASFGRSCRKEFWEHLHLQQHWSGRRRYRQAQQRSRGDRHHSCSHFRGHGCSHRMQLGL